MRTISVKSMKRLGLGLSVFVLGAAAYAASTDIANSPLANSSPTAVKPNLMFTLDDSGSMGDDFMPEQASGTGTYGYWSAQCNGLAYNPAITYALPVDSAGVAAAPPSTGFLNNVDTSALSNRRDVAAVSVTTGSVTVSITSGTFPSYTVGEAVTIYDNSNNAVWMVGTIASFSDPSVTVNVTTTSGSGALASPRIGRGDGRPFYYLYTAATPQPKMSWSYNSTGTVVQDTFYNECKSDIGIAPGSGVFTKKVVSSTSGPSGADERQNYANWFTYYRTRMLMMKTSVSLAFRGIDSKYRVGFNTIRSKNANGTGFLDIADFDAAHKANFYSALNASTPSDSTPLRGALSKVGQYFANKRSGQASDPVQYSCQKNFHILSTDGYWNTGSENSSYGPKALNNSDDVGQQDGAVLRPMFDGVFQTATETETWNTTNTTTSTVLTPVQIVDLSTSVATTTTSNLKSRNTYALVLTSASKANTGFTRISGAGCTTCIVEVSSANHGYQVNDIVVIENVLPITHNYNGTYTVTAVPNANTFRFTRFPRPSNPSGLTNLGTNRWSTTCLAGQGKVAVQEQQFTETSQSIETTVTSTTIAADQRTVTSTVMVTPHTITRDVVNGLVVTTHPQQDGTPALLVPQPPPATDVINQVAQSPVTGAPVITAGTSNPGTPTNVGAVSYLPGCNPVPSPSPSTPVLISSGASTATVVTPTPGSPTPTGSPGSPIDVTQPPVDSAHVTTTQLHTVGGGVSNSLADVAMYYYQTDLRTAALGNCTGASVLTGTPPTAVQNNVCANNVAPRGADAASWQHMTTFTLGLGAPGILKYDPNYLTQTSGDFFNIKQGTQDWPVPIAGTGTNTANIDDLWHAAVNGRGQYFAASDPASLVSGLNGALAGIQAQLGSASAAAASNLQPVAGDNKLFVAQYVTGLWTGDVVALTINPITGVIDSTTTGSVTTPTVAWSAKAKLDTRVAAIATSAPGNVPRQIYYFKKDVVGNTGQLRAFTHANLLADGLNGHVDGVCSKSPALTQCATVDTAAANLGTNMVGWLRGIDNNALYRPRSAPTVAGGSVLGDIVGGAPIYVSKPPFSYTENGYVAWASDPARANRPGTVYVAANDGMVHAFDGSTGEERWAFMPSAVLPNLYKLADFNYGALHQYLVNGAPAIGDVWDGTTWKTILVGGLGAGGRSYYALDITDPTNPVALWEFSDVNLGLTFGNPIITKRATSGMWVVAFASGYNNNVAGGDGNGHLFVLNALTGAKVLTTPTGTIPTYTSGTTAAGTTTTPSGLSKLNVWVDSNIDNTAKRFYGGDLLGNVWRFDIDSLVAPNSAALRLAHLQVGGVAQPITTQVSLAEVSYGAVKYPTVFIGTGQYLGLSDISNTAVQSVYALKDPMNATALGDVHNNGTLVEQTLTETTDANGAIIKNVTKDPVNWATKNGWHVDLTSAGERVNVDPQLIFNTLTVAANIPSDDACVIGGSSFLYRFDIGTGGSAYTGSNTAGTWMGNTMIVGLSFVQLQIAGGAAGSGDTITITVDNAGNTGTSPVPNPASSAGTPKRTSWRELVN